ncbi:S41 family peptidase [Aquimarina spinulae]|uniref:S41 family peptidase n=1 Tax=Aquimarina spinulae TaxID=1192023 RepID=UPI000D561497|nr:S41 family peptidase [Aquimarina spinulae]
MNKLIIILVLIFPFSVFSQDCDCETSFKWVKETFEKNDAGFSYVINQKGKEAYKKHNQEFFKKLINISNKTDCYELIRDWVTFFRKGHFEIRSLNQENVKSNNKNKKWETLNLEEDIFKKYLKNKEETYNYEGIWKSDPYTIGIKKINNEYKGFIIEANGSQWKKGQIKLVIKPDSSSIYYMGDYSSKTFQKTELLGNEYLQLGFVTLKRIFPESESNSIIKRYYKSISTEKPYIDRLNENTLLLRIPTFDTSQKKYTDSLIISNKNQILKTKNLVIDLRDNGGGSIRNYEELLPILYTNRILTVGEELLSTQRNNQRVKDFISNPNWSEEGKEWARKAYKKLSENEGKYVNLETTKVTTTKFDTIYKYPENIGIIINRQNASTTEQFLLAAKQSKKVKLFGQTTFGALDISYTYPAKSPCGDFELIYCLSKSLRIPEMTIDNKGIHPDYFIYDDVPKFKWIDFVIDRLN